MPATANCTAVSGSGWTGVIGSFYAYLGVLRQRLRKSGRVDRPLSARRHRQPGCARSGRRPYPVHQEQAGLLISARQVALTISEQPRKMSLTRRMDAAISIPVLAIEYAVYPFPLEPRQFRRFAEKRLQLLGSGQD